MKLHLPVILLTALMAVLSYVPVANGTVTVTNNGGLVQTEGTISETLSGEVNIEVKKTDDDEDLDALTIAENGIMGVDGGAVSITLSSEGAVTMQVGSEIGGTAAISITDGANFTADGIGGGAKWIYIGHLKQTGEAVLQPNPEGDVSPQFSVTIDGSGSIMSLEGRSGTGSALGYPGDSGKGWVALAHSEGTSGQAAEINVTNGGVLKMSGASVVSCAMGGEAETSATTTINISGDGSKLLMEGGHIGFARASAGSSKVSLTTNITLEKGGVLESDGGYFGYVYGASGTSVLSTTIVEVKDDGKFIVNGGTIGSKQGTGNNTTTIVVSGKGELILEAGNIHGPANTSLRTNSAITLKDEACFRITGGVHMTATVDVYDDATVSFESLSGGFDVSGTIWMHGGKLEDKDGSISKVGSNIAIYTSADYEKDIDVGGRAANRLLSFSMQSDKTSIVNIGNGTVSLINRGPDADGQGNVVLLIGDSRVKKQGVEKELTPIFQFADPQNGKVTLASGKHARLNFTGSHLTELADDGKTITIEVKLTNGTLTGWEDGQSKQWCEEHFEIGSNWDLKITGVDAEGGSLLLTGDVTYLWEASKHDEDNDGNVSVTLKELGDYHKIVVDDGKDVTVTVDGDGTIEQLEGAAGSALRFESAAEEGKYTVSLDCDGQEEPDLGSTVFEGDITAAGTNVTLRKTGNAELKVGGNLQTEGDVAVDEGTLVLGADSESSIGGTLTVGGEGTSGALDVQGNLTATDVNVQNGTLTFGEGSESSIGGELTLSEDGTLLVNGRLTLSGSINDASQGTLDGTGTVVLDGENIVFGDALHVVVENGLTFELSDTTKEANFGNADVTLELSGDKSVEGTSLTLTENAEEAPFTGELKGSASVDGEFHMKDSTSEGCELAVQGDSTLNLTQGGNTLGDVQSGPSEAGENLGATYKLQAGADPNTVKGNFVIRTEDTTIINLDLSQDDMWGDGEFGRAMLKTAEGGCIIIENDTTFRIHNLKDIVAEHSGSGLKNIVVMTGNVRTTEDYTGPGATLHEADGPLDANVELTGILKALFKRAYIRFEDAGATAAAAYVPAMASYSIDMFSTRATDPVNKKGILVFDPYANSDIQESSRSSVAYTGGLLLNHYVSRNLFNSDPTVLEIMEAIGNATDAGNAGEVNRIRAGVAGSTLTSVSAAQSAALRNQMGRVRDHALQAARLRCAGNADEATAQQRPCKNSHVWVEGTSFFSEQHSVGDESGYRLNSWGGAVGIDAQVDAHWSVGVSLSASYGDLEAHAADDAKGDLDTYTVSFWSQAKNGRWGNTLLFTLGTNEADLKRTVNYGAGSYTATSNASGSSLGAMWELTYDFHPVKGNRSNILQPLFNVAVMHTSMDGFKEKNAGGVGLAAEKQTRDTVTLGLGLRWLAAIDSAKAVNRTVTTELHANVAQDLGDRRSETNVALLADPNFTQRVYGSRTGSTAFQFGAGVNVPVTPNSQIYVNAGGELREHANAWNAALGVRMGF